MQPSSADLIYQMLTGKVYYDRQLEARSYETFIGEKSTSVGFEQATRAMKRNNFLGAMLIYSAGLFFAYSAAYSLQTDQQSKAKINLGLTAAFVYLGSVRQRRSGFYGELVRTIDTQGVPAARQQLRQIAHGTALKF